MTSEWRAWVASLCFLAAACFSANSAPLPQGSESHFLHTCSEQCGDGLRCVCGVCTRSCTAADSCSSLSSQAVCLAGDGVGDTRACSGAGQAADVCDERCVSAADCRAGFGCEAGLCRKPPVSAADGAEHGAGSGSAESGAGHGADSGSAESGSPQPGPGSTRTPPLVMLLSDTSGSMERKIACSCESLSCAECLPDCSAAEDNRWLVLLSTLTGSYADYGCQPMQRTRENGATYDLGYAIPHMALTPGVRQRADGLIARYASSVRFGSATFDGMSTRSGDSDSVPQADLLAGLGTVGDGYSYAAASGSGPRLRPDGSAVGEIFYPTCTTTYLMDTGIQNKAAGAGALFLSGIGADLSASTAALQDNLRGVRTYGGTPIAAALDDLYYYFSADPEGAPARQADERRYVILIADGHPDDDYRNYPTPGCGCRTREECGGEDPSRMRCPYPLSADAARHLRCGFDTANCAGPLDKVYVVAFATMDDTTKSALDAIAAAGGTSTARRADSESELRATLTAILNEIVSGAQ